jgi:hypothetical protein
MSNLKSVLGKILSLILVVLATQYHVLAGIVVLLVVVTMNQTIIEGMTNPDDDTKTESNDDNDQSTVEADSKQSEKPVDTTSDDTNNMVDSSDSDTQLVNGDKLEIKPAYDELVSKFKTDHCKSGKLMLNEKEITSDLINTSFPQIKFKGDQCNPCDDDCQFEIVSTNEKLTVEENLRAKDSNSEPIDRETAIKKQTE